MFSKYKMAPSSLLLLLLCAPGIMGYCTFPAHIYDVTYEWRIMRNHSTYNPLLPVHIPNVYQRLNFQADILKIDFVQQNDTREHVVDTLKYKCLDDVTEGRFLVALYPGNLTTKARAHTYQCMEFVRRSRNVLQWRLSEMSSVYQFSLCSTNALHLQDETIVYYHTQATNGGFWEERRNHDAIYTPCPLVGGFVAAWRGSSGSTSCVNNIPPLKLESECEKGEGLSLYVPDYTTDNAKSACVSPLPVLGFQSFFCFANWSDATFTYMVLVSRDSSTFIPCLRVRNIRGNDFKLNIFVDGVCHSQEEMPPSESNKELMVTSRGESNICTDDSSACQKFVGQRCAFNHAQYCRESCDTCAEKPWEKGNFSQGLRGIWLKHTFSQGVEIVNISDRTITIPSLGTYETFGLSNCLESPQEIAFPHDTEEYILVSRYKTGCSPRASKIFVGKRTDSVISMRISKGSLAPLGLEKASISGKWRLADTWRSWCQESQYSADPAPIADKYRTFTSGWFNLVKLSSDTEKLATAKCFMPSYLFKLKSRADEIAGCQRDVEIKIYGSQLKMTVSQCGRRLSVVDEMYLDFQCLATFSDFGASYVITKSVGVNPIVNETLLCWLFSWDNNDPVGYWLPVSDCDSTTEFYIKQKHTKIPFATLIARTPIINNGCSTFLLHHTLLLCLFVYLCNVFYVQLLWR